MAIMLLAGSAPAALNMSGTPFATPRPTRTRHASATGADPARSMIAIGTAVSAAPMCRSRTGPMRRLSASPTSRPAVIPMVNTA